MYPGSTSPLWVIPSMTYLLQKAIGIQHNEYEFLWWVTIPILFTAWFIINFKITK
jgi:hypothetical protein